MTLINSQYEAYLRRMTSDEFQKPETYLPKAFADKMKAEEKLELVKKAYELAEQNRTLVVYGRPVFNQTYPSSLRKLRSDALLHGASPLDPLSLALTS